MVYKREVIMKINKLLISLFLFVGLVFSVSVFAGPKLSESSAGTYKLSDSCGFSKGAKYSIYDAKDRHILGGRVESNGCIKTTLRKTTENRVYPGQNLTLEVAGKKFGITVPGKKKAKKQPKKDNRNDNRGNGNSGTVATQPKAPAYCSSSVKSSNDSEVVDVYIDCNYLKTVNVIVGNREQIVCSNRVRIQQFGSAFACTFERPIESSIEFSVKIEYPVGNQGAIIPFEKAYLLKKGATFDYPVEAEYQTLISQTPRKESKALGRGSYWQSTITVAVNDRDIDVADNVIKIQLIDTKSNKVISTRSASTNKAVSFNLEAQFIEPWMGSDHWDRNASMKGGENTFKIRVFDAYSNTNYMDLETVTITVSK